MHVVSQRVFAHICTKIMHFYLRNAIDAVIHIMNVFWISTPSRHYGVESLI